MLKTARTHATDANFVLTASGGKIVEIQSTAEQSPFTFEHFNQMLGLAQNGCSGLFNQQLAASRQMRRPLSVRTNHIYNGTLFSMNRILDRKRPPFVIASHKSKAKYRKFPIHCVR